MTLAVTSDLGSGPGSLREAIEQANASPNVKRIVAKLPSATVVHVARELPYLSAAGVEFDAGGITLTGPNCVRPDGRFGCDGLVVTGPDVVVRNLRATAFTFDGIAVRGPDAKRVRIEDCESYRNQDDGIGVSAGATDALVKRCKLEYNGYRTKGKGILVFEYATAELVDNTIRYNRDGVTVSRRARARLVRNTIADNYDKGLGVTAAEATGEGNLIARNGLQGPDGAPGPNADGVRVSLDSEVTLRDSVVLDNGDTGVVALGTAIVRLEGGRVAGNKGLGVHARDGSKVELDAVVVENNEQGDLRAENEAEISGARDPLR